MKSESSSLLTYINNLQVNGRYTFTRAEALNALQISPNAFKLSALRLIKKHKLARPKYGFYIIVPTEYQNVGAPPSSWFIHQLMTFFQQPYYVGLLSAAALYGAAHQQPQVFQVVTTKPLRSITVGNNHIEFLTKKNIYTTNYQAMKTPAGYMQVSYPEVTAIDLVRYTKASGHLNNVVTILNELQEKLDVQRFQNLLEKENIELRSMQRLGYLLQLVKANKEIIDRAMYWVKKHRPNAIPLRADKPYENSLKNSDWQLYINETVEGDL